MLPDARPFAGRTEAENRRGYRFDEVSQAHYLAIEWLYDGMPEGMGVRQIPCRRWLKPWAAWGAKDVDDSKELMGYRASFFGLLISLGGVTGYCIFMRRSLLWWPLHPLGYIASQGFYESGRIAFSFFLGGLIKVGILRFGGGGWFKRLRPFFLGLILGEFMVEELGVEELTAQGLRDNVTSHQREKADADTQQR